MGTSKFQRSGVTLPMLAILLLASIAGNVWFAYHHVSVTQVIISLPPSSASQERYEHVPGSKEWHPNFGEPRQFCGMFGAEQCSHAT